MNDKMTKLDRIKRHAAINGLTIPEARRAIEAENAPKAYQPRQTYRRSPSINTGVHLNGQPCAPIPRHPL